MKPTAIRLVKKAKTQTETDLERQTLQQLASRVTDEDHWQTILDQAASPESRAELERVVGPMLAFRRAAPCTTPTCTSWQPGIWQPVLVVASPVLPDERSYATIELHLCDVCKAEATLDDFLTDGIWEQILTQAEMGWPPVRRLTTLAFDRIH